jgi:protein-tyrosine phosphatase
MLVNDNHPESLLHQLPHQTQTSIEFMGRLRLRSPTHRMLNESMRMLVGPVVLAEPCGDGVAVTIEDLLARAGSQISLAIDDGRTRYAQAESTISISEKDFQVVRAGVVSEDSLRRLSSVMVLFVCTGNTCRSPMAVVPMNCISVASLPQAPEFRHGAVAKPATVHSKRCEMPVPISPVTKVSR